MLNYNLTRDILKRRRSRRPQLLKYTTFSKAFP